MSTPVGHTIMGLALARRMGVTSPTGRVATIVAASWPDVDVIIGAVLHRDAWKLHRKGTHTFGFALVSGMLAGFGGLISAGSAEGERDLVADAMTGALLVASHVVLDRVPFPYLSLRKGMPVREAAARAAFNWTLDGVVYAILAGAVSQRKD
jgi:hypothetical protein